MKVKIEHCSWELDSFEELVEKAVNAKPKAAFRPRSYACKTDKLCLQGSQPSAAKSGTQSQPIKEPRVEKSKSRPQELNAPTF